MRGARKDGLVRLESWATFTNPGGFPGDFKGEESKDGGGGGAGRICSYLWESCVPFHGLPWPEILREGGLGTRGWSAARKPAPAAGLPLPALPRAIPNPSPGVSPTGAGRQRHLRGGRERGRRRPAPGASASARRLRASGVDISNEFPGQAGDNRPRTTVLPIGDPRTCRRPGGFSPGVVSTRRNSACAGGRGWGGDGH